MAAKERFSTAKRRSIILKQIDQNDQVDVIELSQMFGVSEVTIRNDLSVLEEGNLLVRARGGAIKVSLINKEIRLSEKNNKNVKEKEAIGKLAATLVKEGDILLIDSGSTTEELAKQLTSMKGITIVTNAINVAIKFMDNTAINVIVPGGSLRHHSYSLAGTISEKNIANYFCDKLFLGVDAIDVDHGIFTPNMDEANLNREMVRVSKEVIVVTDSSKFNKRSLTKITDMKAVHTIITDSKIDKENVTKLEAQGIKVLIAKI